VNGFAVFMTVALSSPDLAKRLEEYRCPNVRIVVFRHHPALLETRERMADRALDEKAILKAVKDSCGAGLRYEGGLGSGFELSLHASDLGRWKAAVDTLHKDGALKYYSRWGLDHNGYGLVPVR
jgi:hypothetical protein